MRHRLIVAIAACSCAAVAHAATDSPDFNALIKRIPPPPAALADAAREARNAQKIAATIEQVEADGRRVALALQQGQYAQASRQSAVASQAAGVDSNNPAQMQALQEKLAHMSPQERMAWAQQYQQRMMQSRMAAMRSRPALASQQTIDELQKIDTALVRYGEVSKRYAPADAALVGDLASLDKRHPTPSLTALGVKVSGSDEQAWGGSSYLYTEQEIIKRGQCHKLFDPAVARAGAWPRVYDAWLKSRRQVWDAAREELQQLVAREQAALARGTGGPVAQSLARASEQHTLDAIQSLLDAVRSYKSNGKFAAMAAYAPEHRGRPSRDDLAVEGIHAAAGRMKKNLGLCLQGKYFAQPI